jgi:hypothetical protein
MTKTIPFVSILLISVFGYGQTHEGTVHVNAKSHTGDPVIDSRAHTKNTTR